MIMIFFLAMASDVEAADHLPMYEGQTSKTVAFAQPYFDCAANAAGKLDRSGDAPTEVAKAALMVCSDQRQDLEGGIDYDILMSKKPALPFTTERIMTKFEGWLVDHLRMRLVAKHAIANGAK